MNRALVTSYRGKRVLHYPHPITGLRSSRIEVPPSRVFAFDYETLNRPNRVLGLAVATFQKRSWTWWPKRGRIGQDPGLPFFLDNVREALGGRMSGTYYAWAHNLEFDLLRVLGPAARSILIGVEVPRGVEFDGWTILRGVYGDRVFLDMRYEDVTLRFRDTFGFFPTSLDKAAKDLGFPAELRKLHRPDDLGDVDPRNLGRKAMDEMALYAMRDAEVCRRVALVIDAAHDRYDVGGAEGFTVSAPHMSAKVFQRMLGTSVIPSVRSKLVLDAGIAAYAGGRSGGTFRGKIRGVSCYDVNAMYSAAMTKVPNFVGSQIRISSSPVLEKREGLVLISGHVTERVHPGLVTWDGRLLPVVGSFDHVWTTTYELRSAVAWKEFSDLRIHRAIYVVPKKGEPEVLKDFIERMYEERRQAKRRGDEVTAYWAKLLGNSLYGKFIQTNDGFRVPNRADHIAIPPGLPEKEMVELRRLYLEGANEHGEREGCSRVLDRIDVLRHRYLEAFQHPLHKWRDLDSDEATTGGLFQIVLGSLITGWSRALLHDLMRTTNAIYYDTDSVFTTMSERQVRSRLRRRRYAGQHLPRIGTKLGGIKLEARGTGEFRQVKRYVLRGRGGKILKEAHHGMPGRGGLAALADGLGMYASARMVSLRGAIGGDLEAVGSIQSSDYAVEDTADPRLVWGPGGHGVWRDLAESRRMLGRSTSLEGGA